MTKLAVRKRGEEYKSGVSFQALCGDYKITVNRLELLVLGNGSHDRVREKRQR